jgi:hypothetical protein
MRKRAQGYLFKRLHRRAEIVATIAESDQIAATASKRQGRIRARGPHMPCDSDATALIVTTEIFAFDLKGLILVTTCHKSARRHRRHFAQRDESLTFRVPRSDSRYRRTLFIYGYEEPHFVNS